MVYHTDRREFLVLAAGGVLAFSGFGAGAAPLRFGFLRPTEDGDDARIRGAVDGLTLGAEEAARTASMFGREVEFVPRSVDGSAADVVAAAGDLLDGGCAALVSALDGAHARAAARAAAARMRPCIHLVAVPHESGGGAPGRGELFVAPGPEARAEALLRALHEAPGNAALSGAVLLAPSASAADLALAVDRRVAENGSRTPLLAAIAQAGGAAAPPRGASVVVLAAPDAAAVRVNVAALGGPSFGGTLLDLFGTTDSLARPELPPRVARADAWAPTLARFGAAQLNDRFRARYGTDAAMRGPAWAGWFAAKILVETALRGGGAGGDGLADALLRARFDGHKGTALSFAAEGHLLQPLHVVGLAGREPR